MNTMFLIIEPHFQRVVPAACLMPVERSQNAVVVIGQRLTAQLQEQIVFCEFYPRFVEREVGHIIDLRFLSPHRNVLPRGAHRQKSVIVTQTQPCPV